MRKLYDDFISKLKKLYGAFDADQKKFAKASNSDISRELGYSDAQFSRLINEHATEGEYQRANQNADRILALIEMEIKLEKLGQNPSQSPSNKWLIISAILGLALIASIAYLLMPKATDSSEESSRYEMLKWSFETSFITPYTKLSELPANCDYPCYKYQGKWQLEKQYKLPIFRERNGFHYLAKDAIMYNRCMSEKSPDGKVMEGYEYQLHEFWYDLREWPIDSFASNTRQLELSDAYMATDFEKDESFVKLSYVHTFFRNEFQYDSTEIIRSGKVIGRDVELISKDILKSKLGSEEKANEILNEVNAIIINRLKDFSKPISCARTNFPNSDFNEVTTGDVLSFDCELTTGRVSIDYNKTYVLKDQYIKNRCQSHQE